MISGEWEGLLQKLEQKTKSGTSRWEEGQPHEAYWPFTNYTVYLRCWEEKSHGKKRAWLGIYDASGDDVDGIGFNEDEDGYARLCRLFEEARGTVPSRAANAIEEIGQELSDD